VVFKGSSRYFAMRDDALIAMLSGDMWCSLSDYDVVGICTVREACLRDGT